MDVQMAPPPYTAAGNPAPPAGNPPVLGQQIPGMSGGLPAQSGLPVTSNPMAEQLRSQGRGDDSMLIHMTPDEVNSLQGLAMAHGGSLTINPETGLPEAGFLKKLLPTILGAALTATGIGAPLAAGLVAAGSVAKTGSLKKGLMAGLSAYGGASLAGGVGLGGSVSKNAFGALSDKAGIFGANMGAGAFTPAQMANYINSPELAQQFATKFGAGAGSSAANMASQIAGTTALPSAATTVGTAGQAAAKKGLAGFAQRFGDTAKAGLPGGMIGKAAPMLAASGLMQGVSGAMTPSGGSVGEDGVIENSYAGPYTAQQRQASFAGDTGEILGSSKERRYFDVDMPEVYNTQGQIVQPGSSTARGTPILQNILNPNAKKGQNRYTPTFIPYMSGYADGGEVGGGEFQIADGGFIVDALSVAKTGNGLNEAGQERFKALGGVPINGPGDGVSDSIPARIGRNQPARVAAGEVYIPPEAVEKIGKGNPERGAQKLYAMMERAHKASKPGQKHNLLRGLA